MSIKTYKTTDTAGEAWIVSPGDPAHGLCDALDKLGWEPLLPSETLRTGLIDVFQIETAVQAMVDVLVELEDAVTAEDAPLVAVIDPVAFDTHRTLRQLRYLKEQGNG